MKCFYLTFIFLRWFKQWGIKMESEKKQRQHKKAMLDDNLESELIPLEHTEKRGKKQVTIIKETPCAYVDNLPQKIISFAEENLK